MHDYSVAKLNTLSDTALKALAWKQLTRFNARLLELHGKGELNNAHHAKLPLRPILCVNDIGLIDDTTIEASFTFPDDAEQWIFHHDESLEMLFQDQLDQLVGFWASRKADGIGRALSSGACQLYSPLKFVPGQLIKYKLTKRKWIKSKEAAGGTAVFNGQILDENDKPILETKNIIVGILPPQDVKNLRKIHGGTSGVDIASAPAPPASLTIPVYDSEINLKTDTGNGETSATATQQINPHLWPFQFHFIGDPVLPGNFGTHGIITLLKQIARDRFDVHNPKFISLDKKNFSGMIFEDTKQIRFELVDIKKEENGCIVAARGNLYLEHADGKRMIDEPIYTFKNIRVGS
ncbi:hypothetical protein OAM69_07000 [bacterium]|nr:hypothetical protein [bacterium]